jgi:hypothetical protein
VEAAERAGVATIVISLLI